MKIVKIQLMRQRKEGSQVILVVSNKHDLLTEEQLRLLLDMKIAANRDDSLSVWVSVEEI